MASYSVVVIYYSYKSSEDLYINLSVCIDQSQMMHSFFLTNAPRKIGIFSIDLAYIKAFCIRGHAGTLLSITRSWGGPGIMHLRVAVPPVCSLEKNENCQWTWSIIKKNNFLNRLFPSKQKNWLMFDNVN